MRTAAQLRTALNKGDTAGPTRSRASRCGALLRSIWPVVVPIVLAGACGGRDPMLDDIGKACSTNSGCGVNQACLTYPDAPPARCWGARVSGQECPSGGGPLAWGTIIPGGGIVDAAFVCTLLCSSNADCQNGLRCDTGYCMPHVVTASPIPD
jgi:hypothetical protein